MGSRLLRGTEISDSALASLDAGFCQLSCLVRKGHDVCGDSAFISCDGNTAFFGVFDGVSGEPGADIASSTAAEIVLKRLGPRMPSEKAMKGAIVEAHTTVMHGFTTALVVAVRNDGAYLAANVGDSALYSLDNAGGAHLEMPLARIVGNGDTIFRFLAFRDVVKSVVGWHAGGMEIRFQKGRLSEGECLISSTDCLPDNLKLAVSEYNVEDASGDKDLADMVKPGSTEEMVGRIRSELERRMAMGGQTREGGYLLAPKVDDLAIVAFRFSGHGAAARRRNPV